MSIIAFRRPIGQFRSPHRVASTFGDEPGLFFCLPEAQRRARIRQLARSGLSAAQIGSICRINVGEVASILDGPRGAA